MLLLLLLDRGVEVLSCFTLNNSCGGLVKQNTGHLLFEILRVQLLEHDWLLFLGERRIA